MHMPASGAGTMKRIAVFYQSTVMTNTQVPAVRGGGRGIATPGSEAACGNDVEDVKKLSGQGAESKTVRAYGETRQRRHGDFFTSS